MDNIHWIYIQCVEKKDERDGEEQHDLVFQKCHYLHRQSFHHFPQISIILWIYMQSMEIRTREMEKREMVLFFKNGIICVDIISIISHKSPPFYGYTICSILYMQSVEIRTREMEIVLFFKKLHYLCQHHFHHSMDIHTCKVWRWEQGRWRRGRWFWLKCWCEASPSGSKDIAGIWKYFRNNSI